MALFLLAYLPLIGYAIFGWVLARRRLPGRVSGIVAAILASAGAIAGMAAFVPILAYAIGVLPLGLVLVAAPRRRGTPDPT